MSTKKGILDRLADAEMQIEDLQEQLKFYQDVIARVQPLLGGKMPDIDRLVKERIAHTDIETSIEPSLKYNEECLRDMENAGGRGGGGFGQISCQQASRLNE